MNEARQEYESRKAANQARQDQAREKDEAAALAKRWFFNHPDKTVKYTGWLQFNTFALFLATLGLVSVTVVSVIVLHATDEKVGKQVEAMGRQLKLMEADQRPWISDVALPTITGPLRMISPNWVMVELKFQIRNSGRSPARRVSIGLELVDAFQNSDLLVAQQRVCSKADKPLPEGSHYVEFTVFPGDQYLVGVTANMIGDEVGKLRETNKWHRSIIVPAVVGCINYQFMSVEGIHQTGIIFRLLSTKAFPDIGLGAIDLDGGPVQPSDMKVESAMVGNGPAN